MEKVLGKKTINNPYMLEVEACTKCFEQKSLPYQMAKLNDIKYESKFTDSCLLVKFVQTQIIKQLVVGIHEQRGVRAIKMINLYVNNKQGVDLAEMRNNWQHWKRVNQVQL
mmetsp:Transcript_44129/g.42821  ORF Transcript_44129/g.42821 Transcript_44129/m.42821 type:complete len:111 (-) Transcript_44129:2041-2373(-)